MTRVDTKRIGLGVAVLILSLAAVSVFAGLDRWSAADDDGRSPAANWQELEVASDYFVILSDPPLASYRGGIDGLAATNPATLGQTKLDLNSAASRAYADYLRQQQDTLIASAQLALDRPLIVRYRYQNVLNGLAVQLEPAEAAVVEALPGVVRVEPNGAGELDTDYGPAWIGAPAIWEATATGDLPGSMGEGVIVGVLDTGINMDHPSFADVGEDGYDHDNPYGPDTYTGWCDPDNPNYEPEYVCNDKLIGAWDYADASWGEPGGPEDTDGHGSHTASTAAGNVVLSSTAVLSAPTYLYSANISGVAPHANVIAYDVCGDSCMFTDLVAATDQAVTDGVDVINVSIGIGTPMPWQNSVALAYLGASDAGVVVAHSAGNEGPNPGTIHRGEPPWVITSAASTHDRSFDNYVLDMAGGNTTPPDDLRGKSLTAGYGPAPIVYAGDYGDEQCLTPFPANTWTDGEIVVCDRGVIARVQKGANVKAGGAAGLVLANTDSSGESINADPHVLPAVHIGDVAGDLLRAWLAGGAGHVATIGDTIVYVDDLNADIMTDFSSRGPHPAVPDLLKPDVASPGLDILAGYKTGYVDPADPTTMGEEFWTVSGTSMASPHTAGAAALIRGVHPDWSPAEVKSALMMTAWPTLLKEDVQTAADPFDVGAGRLDLTKAAMAGLVLDETTANYEDANPFTGGDPKTLNLASMADDACAGTCTFTRTLTSAAPVTLTWDVTTTAPLSMNIEVTPLQFTVGPGETQVITVTADVDGLPTTAYLFASVVLSPQPLITNYPVYLPLVVSAEAPGADSPAAARSWLAQQAYPDLHLTLAVKPAPTGR